MASWVLFEFALQCFTFFAWPCLAMGYPLCASIRAIETKSNHQTKKLVTYWILFSLISLFEHVFFNQLQRIPTWSFTKLAIVCWLVIPSFNGSVSVYKHFVQPCLSVDPQDAINWFLRQTNSIRRKDDFLDKVDRYINDNGTEALEKLLAGKTSKMPKACIDAEGSKLPAYEDRKLKATKSYLIPEESNGANEDSDVIKYQQCDFLPPYTEVLKVNENIEPIAKQVNAYTRREMFEMNETTTSMEACMVDPFCVQLMSKMPSIVLDGTKLAAFEDGELKTTNSCLIPEESKAAGEDSDVIKYQQNDVLPSNIEILKGTEKIEATEAKKRVFEAKEIKETTTACRGDPPPIIPVAIQRKWTCAICQVTTPSEITLKFHLKGKRHVSACEKLKTMPRASKEKVKEKPKPNVITSINPNNNQSLVEECKWSCAICNVNCTGEYDLYNHLIGKKHISKCKA